VIVTALGFVILFLAGLAQTRSNLLGQAPLVYLGEISYSVYMVCVPWKIVFVNLTAKLLQIQDEKLPLNLWLVFLVGVIPLAAASYHFIEKPARDWMKLVAARKQPQRPGVARA
jgi:peptidoglycan/LPS O-acetylase OafA/YrhL